jgi:hypothetical protein
LIYFHSVTSQLATGFRRRLFPERYQHTISSCPEGSRSADAAALESVDWMLPIARICRAYKKWAIFETDLDSSQLPKSLSETDLGISDRHQKSAPEQKGILSQDA